jgi:hypothetical protein
VKGPRLQLDAPAGVAQLADVEVNFETADAETVFHGSGLSHARA